MSLRKFVALVLLGVVLGGCSLAARTFGRYYDDKVISGSVKHGFVAEHGRSLPSVSVDTYERTLREVGAKGFDHIGPTAQPITYVSLYPVAASSGQPEALVTIVLWHVSPAAAAALR